MYNINETFGVQSRSWKRRIRQFNIHAYPEAITGLT